MRTMSLFRKRCENKDIKYTRMKRQKFAYTWLLAIVCSLFFLSATDEDSVHLPDYYVDAAKQCFARHQNEAAKEILDKGVKVHPVDPNIRWLLGRYYYEKQDLDMARYNLIKAVESDYNHVDAKQLLVKVEDESGHYSSAICYVNELLEVNPYWRGLWRRKIDLYRKMGNDVEADRLLERISQIYPEDSGLKKDLAYSYEMSYLKYRKSGNIAEATKYLEKLLATDPDKADTYLALCNMYLQQGYIDRAYEVASRGAERFPSNMELMRKKVGILCEQGRYTEALTYVKNRMSRNNSPALRNYYNSLLVESAQAARDGDPYVMYGKIYEATHSREALDYLLNTSLSRGYYDDARYYLSEAKKRDGRDNVKLLYKEYMLERRFGNDREASALLNRIYMAAPNDYDVNYEMVKAQYNEAERLMANNDFASAIPCVQFVVKNEKEDSSLVVSARERLVTCYASLKRYNEALAEVEALKQYRPDYMLYVERKGDILNRMGHTTAALDLYYVAYNDTTSVNRDIYAMAYEETAVPYIKKLMQDGATSRAYYEAQRLLEVNPDSDLGLRYAINAAALLGKSEEFEQYAQTGAEKYPNDLFYKVKVAQSLDEKGQYDESLELLRGQLEDYPDNPDVTGAYASSSEMYALDLIRDNKPEAAVAVVDSALTFDSDNNSLLYTKGLAYEKMHRLDSAYIYQLHYEPTIAEVGDYNQHMRGLLNRSYKNQVGLYYLHSRPASEDVITSIATVEYTRTGAKNDFSGRVSYKSLDGNMNPDDVGEDLDDGGTGIQLQAAWTHRFNTLWSLNANLAWANDYFPKWVANVGVTKTFKKEWELNFNLGYRRLVDDNNMFSLSPTVSKMWSPVLASLKLDLLTTNSEFYYNVTGQAKFFLNQDRRTNITAMAGIGNYPEITLLDNGIVTGYQHHKTSSMVGLGGTVMLTRNFSVGVLGTWYNYFNPYSEVVETASRHRNIYNVELQLYVNF